MTVFNSVPRVNIPRSSFDRSSGFMTTMNSGSLVPFFVDEVLPGDTFNLNSTIFTRMNTPIFPIMDSLWIDTFYFFCPLRLIWSNFKKFMGERENPADSIDFTVPQMTSPGGGYANQSLHDYFGIPTQIASLSHSSIFHRAYNLTWNQWFRDENLQDSVTVDLDDGPDDPADYVLLGRGKRHDYFTSCLPWPQKTEAVEIPLGESVPIKGIGTTAQTFDGTDRTAYESDSTSRTYDFNAGTGTGADNVIVEGTTSPGGYPNIYADLDNAAAILGTINQLRQAVQIQRLLEKDARTGTRYIEIVFGHFGVTSPDARHQRVEYLGGGSDPVKVTPIAQTSSTDATTPQGNLAAFGTGVSQHGFVKSFTEHGVIIGLVNIRANLSYQQGLNRMFSRSTRYDFYWPSLAQIGEQAVLNKEIYAQADANDDLVFGYNGRYDEYRYKPSLVTGKFRSNDAQTLHAWHLCENYSALPTLSASWILDPTGGIMDRVVAVPSEPDWILDCHHKLRCARPMPLYGVPGMMDHF